MTHPMTRSERAKEKYHTNPDNRRRRLEAGRKWRAENPEKVKAIKDRWVASHLERRREIARNSHRKIHKTPPERYRVV